MRWFLVLLLLSAPVWAEEGLASYYADKFQGRPTASGQPYDRQALTAAHRTHPFGTRLRVTRLDTGQSVEVVVNDRGPHNPERVVDLSRKAAEELDLIRDGVIRVEVEVIP
ncbi:MAG: septal ring lytic transglycosylase RlpA family protein [Candidatus Eremiobacteraeota bacterium]|nr:septal ring lytic transglycosylase RlpA family protein [Candidatus Eremiobacteraeota bacterium]